MPSQPHPSRKSRDANANTNLDITRTVHISHALMRDQARQVEFLPWPTQIKFPSVQVISPTPLTPPQQQECLLRLVKTTQPTYMAFPSIHTPTPGPITRRNRESRWSHGIISGGMVIDILECLTTTAQPEDWSLALWLQRHYVEPFARIERLDGLVVESSSHVEMIQLAHNRFVDLMGDEVRVQRLWVPGLEPTYTVNTTATIIPDLPRRFERKFWRASEMYYKHGFELRRKGRCLGMWRDQSRWQRTLWTAQEEESHKELERNDLGTQLPENDGSATEETAQGEDTATSRSLSSTDTD